MSIKKLKHAKFTTNQHGSMFPLAHYSKAFLTYVRKHPGEILDIGAAYGISSIPALQAGARVTALDLSRKELQILKKSAGPAYQKQLKLIVGKFPEKAPRKENYYDAILASHILHFLAPREFRLAVKKIYTLLKPGAKVFVQCFTPYHRFMETIIPIYEHNVELNKPWPALTHNSARYTLLPGILPKLVNLMDPTVLEREFKRAGFIIEACDFTPCPRTLGKKLFVLDGKEWVGLIASKPL